MDFENLETSQYFRITNFEHDIINIDSGLKDKYFPKEIPKFSRKRKASESDVEEDIKRAKKDIDWREWVSASKVRNYLINDPLLDWLEEYNITNIFDRPDKITGNSTGRKNL